jgi:hypothetical protein
MLRRFKLWLTLAGCGSALAIGCYRESTSDQIRQTKPREPVAARPITTASQPALEPPTTGRSAGEESADRTARMTREYSERVVKGRPRTGQSLSDVATVERPGPAMDRNGTAQGRSEKSTESPITAGASKRAVHVASDSPEVGGVQANTATSTSPEPPWRQTGRVSEAEQEPSKPAAEPAAKPEPAPPPVTKAAELPPPALGARSDTTAPPAADKRLPAPAQAPGGEKPEALVPSPTPSARISPKPASRAGVDDVGQPKPAVRSSDLAQNRPAVIPAQPATPRQPSAPSAAPSGGFVVPKPPDVPTTPAGSKQGENGRAGKKRSRTAEPVAVQVKPTAPPRVETPEPSKAAQPNQPVKSQLPPDTNIKTVIEQRLKEVRANPNDLDRQLSLRLLYVVDNQPEKALEEIPGTNAPVQAIVQKLMKTIVTAAKNKGRDPSASATQMLDSVEELRKLLKSHADLQIPAIKLCTKVDGFGVYEEIKSPSFTAGRRNRFIVYCEVKNFRSEPTEDNQWRVLLAQRIKILNGEGKTVFQASDEDVPYVSHRMIEDFFLVQVVDLPASLSPGKHLLRVYVEDKLAGKATENQVEFVVKSGQPRR